MVYFATHTHTPTHAPTNQEGWAAAACLPYLHTWEIIDNP